MAISAKDVAALRASTGVGMMDCKKALEETNGDVDAAITLLRERGLTKAAERADRENNEGVVALVVDGNRAAIVQLKCETDFVAGSPQFKTLADDMVKLVAAKGAAAIAEKQGELDELKITLKENIELGRVVHYDAPAGHVIDHYLHVQGGRGVNGVLVELDGGTPELAHDIAVHIGFAKPRWLTREEVPADVIAAERVVLENLTRNEGKPEAAIGKIVDGRIGGFYRDHCLLEQSYVKDEKQTITQILKGATIVRFDQVLNG
jgi:elongation factor Ts